jgi:predicted dehydrogenase
LELREESPLVFQPIDGSVETIDYPLFGKERADLEAFDDAVARKSAYPVSDAETIHGIKVFEAIVKSAGGASTVIIR